MISRAFRSCQGYALKNTRSFGTVRAPVHRPHRCHSTLLTVYATAANFVPGLTKKRPRLYNTLLQSPREVFISAESASRPMPPMPFPAQQGEVGRLCRYILSAVSTWKLHAFNSHGI